MDRNVVIATVLIALIMMVWLTWMAPPPPTAEELTTGDTIVAVPPEPEAPPQADTPALSSADSTIAGAQEGTEEIITVETDLYEAQFSTKGATLTSFILKEYNKFDQVTPVQVVDTAGAGALALSFTTPSSHVIDTRSFYFEASTAQDRLQVTDGPVELAFTTPVGAGTLRQVYTFYPDEYEIGLRIEQENAAAFSTQDGYEIIWDGGVPFTEGDVETEARHMGAYARSGGEVEYVDLNSEPVEAERLSGAVEWVAVKNQYFAAVIIPTGETRGAEIEGEQTGSLEAGTLHKDYTARLLVPSSAEAADTYKLYIGPLEFYRIVDYRLGLYDMVDYGYDFFEWITRPLAKFVFIPLFTFLGSFLPNYGLVIILFSILIKLVLYPLTKSSYKNMARMRELQPKMEAIKERYGDDPQKQQEAMMKMYKETGVNPVGGCLPMLLQWPVLIALYQFFPQSLELRQEGFLWATDLSAPDVILSLPFTIPFYGNFVAGFTLLMGLSMIVQMRLQMQPSSNPQAKMMIYIFPVMIFAIFNRFASGLSLYYLVYNVFTAVQQKFINQSLHQEQEAAGQNGQDGAKPGRKAKTASKQRSKAAAASRKAKRLGTGSKK